MGVGGRAREGSIRDNMWRNRVRIEDGERVRRGILSTTVKRQMEEMKVGIRISKKNGKERKRRKGLENFSDVLSSMMGNMQVYCGMRVSKVIGKKFPSNFNPYRICPVFKCNVFCRGRSIANKQNRKHK